MASRHLSDLLEPVGMKASKFLAECGAAGIDVLIICTYRSDAEQAALYAQGRCALAVVNDLRSKVRLAPITDTVNSHKVTNAKPGESEHGKRRAFDVVPIFGGKAVWDSANPMWLDMGKIGKKCGLEWAGDWKTFREFPHFQDTTALLSGTAADEAT